MVAKKSSRTYEVYSDYPGEVTREYCNHPWIIMVRAVSIKQAYWCAANQYMFDGRKGVFFLLNSDGPSRSFPFAPRMRAAVTPDWKGFDRKGFERIVVKDSWY